MMILSKHFTDAVNDYRYLLEKAYPQKSILKLVGDKYQLTGTERSILFRGIATREKCRLRKSRNVRNLKPESTLFIDGYNVIRTIGSCLSGKTVFISLDGFLRDAAEMHRSVLKERVLIQSINVMFEFLVKSQISRVTIYLDEPISKSGELASVLNDKFLKTGIDGHALTVHSPDHHLKEVKEGIICTADSAVVDNCQVKVYDLAKAILILNFKPEFINFEKMKI